MIPADLTFRGLEPSHALRSVVLERVARLERFCEGILSCAVVIGRSEHRHRRGNRFDVRVRLKMRGHDIEAGNTPADDTRHEDAYVAIGDAFDALRRRLQDYARRRRGEVKVHAPQRLLP